MWKEYGIVTDAHEHIYSIAIYLFYYLFKIIVDDRLYCLEAKGFAEYLFFKKRSVGSEMVGMAIT